MSSLSLDTRARLACLFAGAVWGVFWIPLRQIEASGVEGLWVTVLYFGVPAALLLPVLFWRWKSQLRGGMQLQAAAFAAAMAITLYSVAILYTDVIRVMLLFYLTPIWSSLLARVVLGEEITRLRVIAMGLAFLGMLTIFGIGVTFPVPSNLGDWMALGGGIAWAVAAVLINRDNHLPSIDVTIGFFVWSAIFVTVAAFITVPQTAPKMVELGSMLPWLVPIMLLLIIPGSYASIWAPTILSPGLVGLLFMSEIVVGAITAALLSGEPFGWRETIGVMLIAGASVLEPLVAVLRGRSEA